MNAATLDLDEAFARFLAQGEAPLLERVFVLAAPRLLARAQKLVDDPGLAEDLVQETFLVALHGCSGYSPSRRCMPYLLGILQHKARRALQREGRVRTGLDPELESRDGPLELVRSLELRRQIRAALHELSPLDREVLEPYLFEERAPREIARALDRSPGSVRVQIHRALLRMRRALPLSLALVVFGPPLRAAPRHEDVAPAAHAWRLALLCAPVVLALLAWASGAFAVPPSPEGPAAARAAVDAPLRQSRDDARVAAAPSDARSKAPPSAKRPFGSLHVQLSWRDSEEPAAHVGILMWPAGREAEFHGRRAVSGADGRAAIDDLTPGTWVLQLDRGTRQTLEIEASRSASLHVELAAGITVRGRVVDENDAAIPNARIWLTDQARHPWLGQVVRTSDQDGRFVLRGLEAMSGVAAHKDGYAPSVFRAVGDAREQDVVLALGAREGKLRGRVVDRAGRALPFASVWIGQRPRSEYRILGGNAWTMSPNRIVRCDAHGRFEARALPATPLRVLARARGHVAATQSVALRAGETAVAELRLARGRALRGRVVDQEGRGAASVWVHAQAHERHAWSAVRTDADGRFELEDLDPERGRVQVRAHGYHPLSRAIADFPDPERRVELRLRRQDLLRGTLRVGEERVRVEGWSICVGPRVVRPGARAPETHQVDAEGGFSLLLPESASRVFVRPPRGAFWCEVGERLLEDATRELRAMTLDVPVDALATSTLRGRLRGLPRSRRRAVLFLAERDGWTYELRAEWDAEGMGFTLRDVMAGAYELRLSSRDGSTPELALGSRKLEPRGVLDLGEVDVRHGVLEYSFALADRGRIEVFQASATDESGLVARLPAQRDGETLRGRRALRPGRYEIEVLGSGLIRAEARFVTVHAGRVARVLALLDRGHSRRVAVLIPRERAGRLAAVLRDERGRELANGSLAHEGGGRYVLQRTLRLGKYTLEVRVGEETLRGSFWVRADDDASRTTQVQLRR